MIFARCRAKVVYCTDTMRIGLDRRRHLCRYVWLIDRIPDGLAIYCLIHAAVTLGWWLGGGFEGP